MRWKLIERTWGFISYQKTDTSRHVVNLTPEDQKSTDSGCTRIPYQRQIVNPYQRARYQQKGVYTYQRTRYQQTVGIPPTRGPARSRPRVFPPPQDEIPADRWRIPNHRTRYQQTGDVSSTREPETTRQRVNPLPEDWILSDSWCIHYHRTGY